MTRLTDDERDDLVHLLRRHLVDGRIDLDEFSDRVGRVYAAASWAEAAHEFDDLPVLPPEDGPRRSRRGAHGESEVFQPGWRATYEVFRDPASGVVVRVWVDPADGSRHYVAD